MSTKRTEQLQQEIQENLRELQEVKQTTLVVEEEITCSRRETERQVELTMENGELVNALQQLGCLLQEETRLSEELSTQAASDGIQMSLLEERSRTATDKARSLAAEILEVKERLAKVKARQRAAQPSAPTRTNKSKIKQQRK